MAPVMFRQLAIGARNPRRLLLSKENHVLNVTVTGDVYGKVRRERSGATEIIWVWENINVVSLGRRCGVETC
jgi:hypothetical protein